MTAAGAGESAPCNWTDRLENSWENIKAIYEPEKLLCEGPGLWGVVMAYDGQGQTLGMGVLTGIWLATEKLGTTECEAMAPLRWRMVRQ